MNHSIFCRRNIIISVLCIAGIGVSAYADPLQKGTQLATKVYNRPDGKTVQMKVSMTITLPKSSPRLREFLSLASEPSPGTVNTLIRFLTPAEVFNTSLLTMDSPGPESKQWIFLPALKRSREIASSRKGGRFVGSDYIYEDLTDREVGEDNHLFKGEEKINGVSTYVLESVPKLKDSSVYGKRVAYIHPQALLPLRIDFYDKENKKIKVLDVQKIEKVGGFWTIMNSKMKDMITGGETELVVGQVKYNLSVPEDYFSKRTLESPEKIREL